jgi:hypothetical protein
MTLPPAAAVRSDVAPGSRRPGVGWTTELGGAIRVPLLRPVTWPFGLASFLAGGGILLLGLPVASLPTPSGIQNALGGPISTLVVGTPSNALIALIVATIATVGVAIVGGTVIGAWAEREGVVVVADAAEQTGLAAFDPRPATPGVGRVAGVRLLSLLPLAVAAGLAWPPLYDAIYRELVLPTDLATPLAFRVIRSVPLPLALLGVTWLLSDAAASIGVRVLVRDSGRMLRAWAMGWLELFRRPLRSLGTAVFGLAWLVILVGPSMLVAVAAWGHVRTVLPPGGDAIGGVIAVIVWVAAWLGTLTLAGLASAVRAAAWTLMVLPAGERDSRG